MSFVVAIDGPAGSGKGTVTKIVAERMGLVNIDTGAMYRCVTLMCLENNIDYTQIDEINKILDVIKIEIKNEDCNQTFYLNGRNVTKEIRYENVNKNVAKFAAVKEIRDKVTPMQRAMGEKQDIILSPYFLFLKFTPLTIISIFKTFIDVNLSISFNTLVLYFFTVSITL